MKSPIFRKLVKFSVIALIASPFLFVVAAFFLFAFGVIGDGEVTIVNHTPAAVTDIRIEHELSQRTEISNRVESLQGKSRVDISVPSYGESGLYVIYVQSGKEIRLECGYYDGGLTEFEVDIRASESESKCDYKRSERS